MCELHWYVCSLHVLLARQVTAENAVNELVQRRTNHVDVLNIENRQRE